MSKFKSYSRKRYMSKDDFAKTVPAWKVDETFPDTTGVPHKLREICKVCKHVFGEHYSNDNCP